MRLGLILFLSLPFGALFYMYFIVLLKTTKSYIITPDGIEVINLLTFQKTAISKKEILGFSTSEIPYKIGNFKEILIYLKNGDKIDLMQFAYFNFKKIEPALIDKRYDFLGYEPYIWKWVNSRVYKFDK
ncbi:hypothetical protein [Pedobacter sp. SYSU D00535]|uniref:hypothetical protein n=1 Tax=Pedobacter sp. SYSU D00535 TaxID=2810308 RepID=UPI001A976B18|nr:hypothetical protein [Pedobacter sp. SYSU D00535]